MKGKRADGPPEGKPVANEAPTASATASAMGGMQPDRKVIESVKYEFTRTEMLELGGRLARAAERVYEIEREKAEASARIGAAIKAANIEVAQIAEKIRSGYEMREMECTVMFDRPRVGMKATIRPDTEEVIREEAMTKEEMQRTLFADPLMQ